MVQANLSETLFKPRFKHPETSTLIRRVQHHTAPVIQSALDGKTVPHWYRMINRLLWVWRGVDPREILQVVLHDKKGAEWNRFWQKYPTAAAEIIETIQTR